MRRYFYWRLRRRLQEEAASKRLATADPTLTREARMAIVQSTLAAGDSVDETNDEAVTLALEKGLAAVDSKVKQARSSSIAQQVAKMSSEDHDAVVEGVKQALGQRLSGSDLEVRRCPSACCR